MIDLQQLRQNIEMIAARLYKERGFKLDVIEMQRLEVQRKTRQIIVQDLQHKRNKAAKVLGQEKAKGLDIRDQSKALKQDGVALKVAQTELQALQSELEALYLSIPNLLHPSVPNGKNSNDNRVERHWGTPNIFTFTAKDHLSLGRALKQLDMERAAKLSGARFSVLYGDLARLQRALIQFMLNTHTANHGYQEVYVPYLVKKTCLYGTGQLPKFKEDDEEFSLAGAYCDLTLIPTAEVPVTNLVCGEIIPFEQLPLKWVAHTPCFRSEAGSYGKDVHGLLRMHQFEKVELVQITHPDQSEHLLEEIVGHAEFILQQLELPYRVVTLCSGDTGFSSAKTYDLEVWIPSQKIYREISSCSNFEDFQARRLKARFRDQATGKPRLVHTLNGSALAISRALLAIMENHQDENGRIYIPSVLQPYMNQQSHLDNQGSK